RKAASALPAAQRPKLEEVTGGAPMKRLRRIRSRTTGCYTENGLFAPPPQERPAQHDYCQLEGAGVAVS
ncbi:MAG: hypothetical protein WBW11_01045, partial [Pseudolabrys sp.]